MIWKQKETFKFPMYDVQKWYGAMRTSIISSIITSLKKYSGKREQILILNILRPEMIWNQENEPKFSVFQLVDRI